MQIVYLGVVVSEKKVNSMSGISVAGNKMQLNVLHELHNKKDVELKVISFYPLCPFPREKRVFVKKSVEELFPGQEVTQVGYINIPLIKQMSQICGVYRVAMRATEEGSILFSYNLFPQVGNPFLKVLKKKKVKGCTLLADLPIDSQGKRNVVSKFLADRFHNMAKNNILSATNFVVLNKHAVERFCKNANYIVVDGAYKVEKPYNEKRFDKIEKNIVYSGALATYSGIMNAVEAMKYVNDKNICLEIYGDGELRETIKTISKDCKNIKYCGSVSNQKMQEIQSEAWLLLNPRPVDNEIAKVTFPSKIFEYMVSGRPTLSTKLNGFTDEYKNLFYWIENDDAQGIAKAINQLACESESSLKDKAQSAYEFVVKEKTWAKQGKKIYSFLKSL